MTNKMVIHGDDVRIDAILDETDLDLCLGCLRIRLTLLTRLWDVADVPLDLTATGEAELLAISPMTFAGDVADTADDDDDDDAVARLVTL